MFELVIIGIINDFLAEQNPHVLHVLQGCTNATLVAAADLEFCGLWASNGHDYFLPLCIANIKSNKLTTCPYC